MKIGLGTVQFGVDYGVSNKNAIVPEEEVGRILRCAVQSGIDIIDTAALYGTSEKVLGKYIADFPGLKVITKTPVFSDNNDLEIEKEIIDQCHISLENLGIESIYGLLLHHAADFTQNTAEQIIEAFAHLKAEGLVTKTGISAYNAQTVESIMTHYKPDIVQVPVNIADQRLIKNGFLHDLKTRGIEIHARSIFLQGLLLMGRDKIPSYFLPIQSQLDKIHSEIAANDMSDLEACLQFTLVNKDIDHIIVGVTSREELLQIMNVIKTTSARKIDWSDLHIDKEEFLNPSNWKYEYQDKHRN